ncbi:MAG: hypothetical protein LBS80_01350 [Tannerella sp.]|jgi:hypothetical protein|nr:hypothetical protein [Tannerella sp.]
MKKAKLLILTALFCQATYSQNDTQAVKSGFVVYSVFCNIAPHQFKFPLIGFVNVATGDYQGLQLGFVNTTLKGFKGVQAGFVNTTLKNADGLQLGFVNTTVRDFSGMQAGFVNTTPKNADGLQLGFVNTAGKGIKGSQLGFVNYADSITNGIPIGFVSIVKKGGYRAIEISANELYPVNLSFKIGVPRFYSYIQGGYNPRFEKDFAFGAGFGALCPIGKNLYFNPEIGSMNPIGKNNHQQMLSLVGSFRYELFSAVQIAVGPSAVWMYSSKGEDLYKPEYSIANRKIDNNNRLLIGVRAALSVNF